MQLIDEALKAAKECRERVRAVLGKEKQPIALAVFGVEPDDLVGLVKDEASNGTDLPVPSENASAPNTSGALATRGNLNCRPLND